MPVNFPIRFAVIGTSKITHAFIDAAKQDKRFYLQAVYSRTQQTANDFAAQYGVKQTFTQLNELAKSKDIDAVYIASPNSLHAKQAILLMQAGKHVLCEKPVAANAQQLNDMIAAAKSHQVSFMEAMMITHEPNFKQIEENLHRIGPLRKYYASFCQYSSRYDLYKNGENPNTFNPQFANGSLVDIGIYPLYPAIKWFGVPNTISSQCHKLASGVDGCGDVLLSYENADHQVQAVITHSKISNSENVGEIQGELGRIVWHHASLYHSVSIEFNHGKTEELSLPQNENRMTYELKHFIDMIQQQQSESSINTWQLSQQVQDVMDTVRKQQQISYPSDD